jgi:hypothetical protein
MQKSRSVAKRQELLLINTQVFMLHDEQRKWCWKKIKHYESGGEGLGHILYSSKYIQ